MHQSCKFREISPGFADFWDARTDVQTARKHHASSTILTVARAYKSHTRAVDNAAKSLRVTHYFAESTIVCPTKMSKVIDNSALYNMYF